MYSPFPWRWRGLESPLLKHPDTNTKLPFSQVYFVKVKKQLFSNNRRGQTVWPRQRPKQVYGLSRKRKPVVEASGGTWGTRPARATPTPDPPTSGCLYVLHGQRGRPAVSTPLCPLLRVTGVFRGFYSLYGGGQEVGARRGTCRGVTGSGW